MLNTAFIYAHLGRLEEPAKLRNQRLKILRKPLGATHSMTMAGIAGLVRLYSNKNSSRDLWEEAGRLGREVLQLRKESLSEENPDTIDSTADLMVVYTEQAKRKELPMALALCNEVDRLYHHITPLSQAVRGEKDPKQKMRCPKAQHIQWET